jgi:hypothetical protein
MPVRSGSSVAEFEHAAIFHDPQLTTLDMPLLESYFVLTIMLWFACPKWFGKKLI